MSFEQATGDAGGRFLAFAMDASSSVVKGETLRDSFANLDAMGVDVFVVRHSMDRLPHTLTGWVRGRVVNAGDGRHAHPTQALLDVVTVCEAFDRDPASSERPLEGLSVAICGDIEHGRVGKSSALALTRLGAQVRLSGPDSLCSAATAARLGAQFEPDLDRALDGVDVAMMLRIQHERLPAALELSKDSYHARWGLTQARAAALHDGAIVMHPGPINRGVEIADSVADGPRSRILRQVSHGVALRTVALAHAAGALDVTSPLSDTALGVAR